MGNNAHRLSLEWSRIEPEPSVFDDAALGRYREILQALHDRGMQPMVTLHHFSNPVWLVEKGDFSVEIVVDYFRRYAEHVVDSLGDLVAQWVTINEPMVYVVARYLEGAFPAPKQRGWGVVPRVLNHLLRCHVAAYEAIKAHYPQAPAGVAKNMIIFQPAPPGRGSPLNAWWAARISSLFNDWWMEAIRRSVLFSGIPRPAGQFDSGHQLLTRRTAAWQLYDRGEDAVSDGTRRGHRDCHKSW